MCIMDFVRLLGFYFLEFLPLVSFLLRLLVLLQCCLPQTYLLVVSAIFVTADKWNVGLTRVGGVDYISLDVKYELGAKKGY